MTECRRRALDPNRGITGCSAAVWLQGPGPGLSHRLLTGVTASALASFLPSCVHQSHVVRACQPLLTNAWMSPTAAGTHPHTAAQPRRPFPDWPQTPCSCCSPPFQAAGWPPSRSSPALTAHSCTRCCPACDAFLTLLYQVISLMAQLKCPLLWEALLDLFRQI